MSLNPSVIARDQTHRRRAIGTLAGFTAIVVICALGVMGGQDHVAVGSSPAPPLESSGRTLTQPSAHLHELPIAA